MVDCPVRENHSQCLVCVECGAPATKLYHTYGPSTIKLCHCHECDAVVDSYIEQDNMLIVLDLVGHRVQAYRHFLHNFHTPHLFRFGFISLVLESYVGWMWRRWTEDEFPVHENLLLAAKEGQFYQELVHKLLLNLMLFLFTCLLCTVFCNNPTQMPPSRINSLLLRSVLFISISRFFVIPALGWVPMLQQYAAQWTWLGLLQSHLLLGLGCLISLTTLAKYLQAIFGRENSWWKLDVIAFIACAMANGLAFILSYVCIPAFVA